MSICVCVGFLAMAKLGDWMPPPGVSDADARRANDQADRCAVACRLHAWRSDAYAHVRQSCSDRSRAHDRIQRLHDCARAVWHRYDVWIDLACAD